jgi:hypothetical protein
VQRSACSNIAGLSHALGRETLILQAGEDPVPLDLRDTVSIYSSPESIDPYIAAFAPRIPGGEDSLFALIESPRLLDNIQLRIRLAQTSVPEDRWEELTDLLLWYGVLGILRKSCDETYIYDVNYEMRKLKALVNTRAPTELVYVINPAFWRGLDIEGS